MKNRTAIIMIVLAAVAALASCRAGDPTVIRVRPVSEFTDEAQGLYIRTLKNGLRVVVKENRVAPVAHVYLLVNTGSMHEEEYLGAGMSHIFEHVMAGGTTTMRTGEENKNLLRAIGGVSNAGTTVDRTDYYVTTTSRYFDQALDLISSYVMYCTFDRTELEREFGVILKEIAKSKEEPMRIMGNLFFRTAYDAHPIRYPTIGFRERFLRLNREDIVKYYNRRYVPRNMVLGIGGDINAKEVLEKVEKVFGGFEDRPLKEVKLPEEPKKAGYRYAEGEAPINMAMLRMGFRTVALGHPDTVKTDMLSAVLGLGKGSRLNRRLVEEKRLVEDIASGHWTPEYVHGHFTIGASMKTENLEAAQAEIMAVIEDLKKNLVKKEELDRARTYLKAARLMYRQTAADEIESLAQDMRITGDPFYDDKYLAAMDAVTPAMVREMARKYLNRDNLTTVVLRPGGAGGEKAALPPLEAGEKESGITKFKMDNGLTVLLKRNPELPLVSMQIYSRGGVLFDGERPGLSNFMAQTLMRGTTSRTAAQISDAVDSMGAKMDVVSGNNTFGLEMTLLREDLEKGVDLMSDVFLRPAFDGQEVGRVREQTIFQIRNLANNWGEELSYHFRKARFDGHPYANHRLGSAESVAAITPADLRAFHERYCVGSNAVLAVFGDIDIEKARALVEKAFGGMRKGDAGIIETPPPPPIGKGSAGVDKPVRIGVPRNAVNVILATNGLPIGDDADAAMRVLQLMLDARLYEALRGRNDYVYLVAAYNMPGFGTGVFQILTQTTPDKYDAVMKEIRLEIEKMKSGEFTDEELENARRRAVSYVELGSQTNADQADVAALNELHGIGCDYMAAYPRKLAEVSREDVMKLIERCFGEWMVVETRPMEKEQAAPPGGE